MIAKYNIIHTAPHSSPYCFSFPSNRIKAIVGIGATVFLNRRLCWMQQVHPDDRQHVKVSVSDLNEGDTLTLNYRVLNHKGRYLEVLDSVSLVKESNPDELTLVGNIQADHRNSEFIG